MEGIELLCEEPEYVVCIKPAGVLSQRGRPGETDMLTLLEEKLDGTVFPVHRLDRETGGVMVYARTPARAAELSRMIQQGRMEKEYLAVLKGVPQVSEGRLEDILFHDSRRNKSYVVKRQRKGARQARLAYRVLETREGTALVQVRLYTGRTHQIRVQFASRGLPLVGDRAYGGGSGKLLLWSCRLTLRFEDGTKRSFFRLPKEMGGYQTFPPLTDLPEAWPDEKELDKPDLVQ